MASWIYIFSKFTPEALLFEALVICLLCSCYAAFWVLKKRKYGVLGKDVPNYAVKSYLTQLILDAEQMRIQLFGLLAGSGFDPNLMANLRGAVGATAGTGASPLLSALGVSGGTAASAAALAADPELGAKLAAIESKMVEQAKAIETITVEKVRIEKELIEARAGKGGGGGGEGGSNDAKLAEKIKALEAKLSEYSVIEDDLANLKRLQQENVQLKAQLGGKAVPLSEVAAAAGEVSAPPAEAAAAADSSGDLLGETQTEAPPAVAAAEAEAAAPSLEEAAAAEAVAATDAAISEAATAEPIAASTGDAGFEGLVDQVEQSLVEPNPPATPAAAEPAAGASVADTAAGATGAVTEAAAAVPSGMTPTPEKTDADLVAEFEKMLNS
jgi:hypothetical protein